ncbi:hypothetical protein [Streptomyces kronopolitis]|uniref:hypothetical protein n=1 Tax=Streptomyces kronopolitis TaxID=1612435 RepID=UPI003D994E5D
MVSLLRDIDRRTRTTTRRARPASPPQPAKSVDAEPVTPPPAPAPPAVAAVVETGKDGRARWTFPASFSRPPALTALPVDPHPADDTSTFVATLETVSGTYAELRVWRTRPLPVVGGIEPAGPGIRLHLTATPTTA